MPLNHTKLEKRLSDCDEKLSALFKDVETNNAIKKHLLEVQNYYNLSYTNTKKDKTAETIVSTYEEYIIHLENVKTGYDWYKNGLHSYAEATAALDKAHDAIVYANTSRHIDVVRHDLANICALMFWASTALALYASVYLIALPMLIVQPVLGIAMGITIGGFFLKSAANCINCCSEFKGFSRHSAEYEHERMLFKFFFKPAQQFNQASEVPQKPEEREETSSTTSCSL